MFTYQNKGDAVLVCSLVQALRARYGAKVRITLASLHPDTDRGRYEAPVGPEPLRRFRDAGSTRWAGLAVLTSWVFVLVASVWARVPAVGRVLPREWRFVLEAARSADVAVSVPGGYLMAPTRGSYWWLSHFCTLWACIAARTPLVLAPCSIGPFVRRYRPLARRLLRRVDLIVLRETQSLKTLRELAVDDRRILLGADMGFAYRPEPRGASHKKDKPAGGVLLGGKGLGGRRPKGTGRRLDCRSADGISRAKRILQRCGTRTSTRCLVWSIGW
jgi:polysaccharide pyruvyl transferase WcaK-like protein